MTTRKLLLCTAAALSLLPSMAKVNTTKTITTHPKTIRMAKAASETALFYESFEKAQVGYNQPSGELPEGWTRTGNNEGSVEDRWFTYYATVVNPADGDQLMEILYDSSNYKDEQIITPAISITAAGYELSFYWWIQPLYLFRVGNDFVDYESREWKQQVVAANLEVLVQVVGDDTWQKVYDLAEQYMGFSYIELSALSYDKMQRASVDLASYAGKTIKVAFRYVGTDGDSMFLDAVAVDKPALSAHYSAPLCRQFFGMTLDGELQWLAKPREYYPHSTDLTWYNNSYTKGDASFLWTYDDPSTGTESTSSDPYELTLNFDPETMPAAKNVFNTPTLKAYSDDASSGTYRSAAQLMQVGGKPTETVEGEEGKTEYVFGLLPFDIHTEGLDIYVKEPLDFGREDIPVFGYSEDSDLWWTNYTFPRGAGDDEFAYCTGFINWIQTGNTPMWLRGANVAAIGDISDEAQFSLKVLRLEYDEESGDYLISETPVAVAHTSGAEVKKFDRGMNTKYLSLNFQFDNTLVITPEDYVGGFLVEVTGYHDGGVRYFAPLQSMVPNEDELCLGFYRHHCKFAGIEDDNISYCANLQTADGRDLYTTFAISLDAEYPLPGDVDGISDTTTDNLRNSQLYNLEYNIAGQRVGADYRGIVITGGKKTLRQ